MSSESLNPINSKQSDASSGGPPSEGAELTHAFDTSTKRARDWTFHLVDEDPLADYSITMGQADSLLATWIIRAWKNQKELALTRTQ